jgi:hypothetical protein
VEVVMVVPIFHLPLVDLVEALLTAYVLVE